MPEELGHARWRLFADSELRSRLFTNDAQQDIRTPVEAHIAALFEDAGNRTPVNRNLYVDVRSYLCDNILAKLDRMSMAVSLEARVPMLDKELVELAFQLPDTLKVHRGRSKILLKQVAARHVPAKCVYRPKEGFSMPVKNWLRGPFRGLLENFLDERRIREAGLFQVETIEQLKTEHMVGSFDHSHVLWALVVFEAWRDKWLCHNPVLTAPDWSHGNQVQSDLPRC